MNNEHRKFIHERTPEQQARIMSVFKATRNEVSAAFEQQKRAHKDGCRNGIIKANAAVEKALAPLKAIREATFFENNGVMPP